MRVMRPILTEQGCLLCHARQGYTVGQIRGGVSAAVPMAPYRAIERRNMIRMTAAHAGLWLIGLAGIALAGRGLVRGQRQRLLAAAEIEQYARDLEEANGLKELFIDIMRHDFLSPATVIQSYAMYLEEGDGDPKLKEMLSRITHANTRLIEMIRDASELSRLADAEDSGVRRPGLGPAHTGCPARR